MKQSKVLLALLVSVIGMTAVVTIRAETNNNVEKVTAEISEVKSNSTTVINTGDTSGNEFVVPNNNPTSLTEIVITAEEIKSADSEGKIGIHAPMNKKYIIDTDIVESINRILKDSGNTFDEVPADIKSDLIKLRYMEMLDNVSESKSSIKSVIKEHQDKQSQNLGDDSNV